MLYQVKQSSPSYPYHGATVKRDNMVSVSRHRVHDIKFRGSRYASLLLRDVEITCLNRLYKGIGFRNTNGGLEFYCKEYKENRQKKNAAEISDLCQYCSSLEEERSSLSFDLVTCEKECEEWYSALSDLQQRSASVSTRIKNLSANEGKSMPVKDRVFLRKQLKAEFRQLNDFIAKYQGKIESFLEKKKRLSLLNIILPQLRAKITDRKKENAVASFVTLDQPGILEFPLLKGMKNKSCCLFFDIFDYLSYSYLVDNSFLSGLPRGCDCIVMNDIRNFITLLLHSDDYDNVYCFFPNTVLGKTMEKTVTTRKKSRVASCSSLFKNCTTLYEFVTRKYKDFSIESI